MAGPARKNPVQLENAMPEGDADREALRDMFVMEDELESGEAASEPVVPDDEDDEDSDSDDETPEEVKNEEEPAQEAGESDHDWKKRHADVRRQQQALAEELRLEREARAAEQQQLADLRQQQALQQGYATAQQEAAQMAAQQAQNQQIPDAAIVEAVEMNHVDVFRAAAQQRPELVPRIISAVRNNPRLGHAVADQMQFEYTQYTSNQQAQRLQQQMQQQHEQAAMPARVQQGMEMVLADVAQTMGEKRFTKYAPVIQAKMTERWQEHWSKTQLTPDSLTSFVSKLAMEALREDGDKRSKSRSKEREIPAGETAEGSTPGAAPNLPAASGDSDEMITEMVNAHARRQYE